MEARNQGSRWKRILGWIAGAVLAMVAGLCFYLFYDTPFPSIDTDELIAVHSTSIPKGHAFDFRGDSVKKNIVAEGIWFKDLAGRTMILHGINVGGSSKVPFKPLIASHVRENFLESAYTVSFAGRPFPLEQADEHLARLHHWGYRFLRLLVTWEAIEHAGPGKYDEEYIQYIREIVKKAASYGINVFIDPHQDVWSRFTGGDGAPYWTLEVVGINPIHINETGAAVVHNLEGDPFPKMLWPTNYFKLAASTMFAVFFGSEDFAPALKVEGVSAQEYLQSHYINAMKRLALELKGLPNVIGFDVMNEPTAGLIGAEDLESLGILQNGAMPTPFQGMIAAAGIPVEVPYYEFSVPSSKLKGNVKLNPMGTSLWKTPESDIWRNAGVWNLDPSGVPQLKRPRHFSEARGRQVDFSYDYYRPFVNRFAREINSIDSTWLIFAEHPTLHELPRFAPAETRTLVNASHSYDAVTLLTKEYNSWLNVDTRTLKLVFGRTAIREMFHSVMAGFKEETEKSMGLRPTLLGEFGVPMDLHNKQAYLDDDFSDQDDALDRSFRPLESNLMSYTLWVYTADNDNIHGDQWNGEDLSIFSLSQQKKSGGIYSGGRALGAAIRAYPYKVAGQPMKYFFDKKHKRFYLKFKSDPLIQRPTEIYLPDFHFGRGFKVISSPAKLSWDQGQSLLLFIPEKFGVQEVVVESEEGTKN